MGRIDGRGNRRAFGQYPVLANDWHGRWLWTVSDIRSAAATTGGLSGYKPIRSPRRLLRGGRRRKPADSFPGDEQGYQPLRFLWTVPGIHRRDPDVILWGYGKAVWNENLR